MTIHYVSLALGVVLNAAANILLKSAMRDVGPIRLSPAIVPQVLLQPAFLLGVTCFALALVAYSFALTEVELSIGYPIMMSVGLVIVVAYSALVFGERISGYRMLGLVLVMVGISILFGTDAQSRTTRDAPPADSAQ